MVDGSTGNSLTHSEQCGLDPETCYSAQQMGTFSWWRAALRAGRGSVVKLVPTSILWGLPIRLLERCVLEHGIFSSSRWLGVLYRLRE